MADQAPRTRFNVPVERARTYAVAEMDLRAVKAAGREHGAKLNDVFLAICGGALRRYFERNGRVARAIPDRGLPRVAAPPRGRVDEQPGHHDAGQPRPPTSRIRRDAWGAIMDSSAIAKEVTADLAGAFERDPAALGHRPLAHAKRRQPSWKPRAPRTQCLPPSTSWSRTYPAPREPLYSNGARMLTHYPVSIPAHGMGVNITVQSYVDKLYVGITACARALPDAALFRDDLVAEYEALCTAFVPAAVVPRPVEPTPLPTVKPEGSEIPPAKAA